jgi:nucleoside-diphosphate-sugar epimerase
LIGDKKDDVHILYGNIAEMETVRDVIKGTDFVFHLAALVGVPYSYAHTNEVVEVNTMGTLNVLAAARERQVDRVVVASTSDVYGTAIYVPIDERHPKQPQSPYAASKIAAEALALAFHYSFRLPVVIVRPFNTYGPRQSDRAIIPTIISQALVRDEISVGNIDSTRDFTFVSDTVEGFIKIAESEESVGQEINLGSGREITIGELAVKIGSIIGRDIELRQVEQRLRPPQSEVRRVLADNSKAKHLTGWQPQVDLDRGLGLTVEWIKNHPEMYDPSEYRT